MPVNEQLIRESVDRYERERDRFVKLSGRIADICRTEVDEHAIRAQVTSRTKTVKSFEGKVRRRVDSKKYEDVDDVFRDIGDFSGVRIALYQPEDEWRTVTVLEDRFRGPVDGKVEVDEKDKFDIEEKKFYKATHCQVHLPEEDCVEDYENLLGAECEIQVCTMMAHLWNEIEHEIAYKPESGGPSEVELGLLESLGFLTRSGDALIARLLEANVVRMTNQSGDFMDMHDFVARLRGFYSQISFAQNAGRAFEAARALRLNSIEDIERNLGRNALEYEIARDKILAFNQYLRRLDRVELQLNPKSADLLVIGMLEKYVDKIIEHHSGGPDKGRPPLILRAAKAYKEFSESSGGPKER